MSDSFRGGTLQDFQSFVASVYGPPNGQWFDCSELIVNAHRFAMRSLKGVRRGTPSDVIKNLAIALSWLTSAANRLDIQLDEIVWTNFRYKCPYCGDCPCVCPQHGSAKKRDRPRSLSGYQAMFSKIYPQREGSLFPAASHMAEEMGEVAEAVMMYRTVHSDDALSRVSLEFADLISCVLGVCNSIASAFPNEETILEEILKRMFANGCHACHGSPCTCAYSYVMTYGEDPSRTRIA